MNVVPAVPHVIRDPAAMAVPRGTTDAAWVEVQDPNPTIVDVVNGGGTGIPRVISLAARGLSVDGTAKRVRDDSIGPVPVHPGMAHLVLAHRELAHRELVPPAAAHLALNHRVPRCVPDHLAQELLGRDRAQSGVQARAQAFAVEGVIHARKAGRARCRTADRCLGRASSVSSSRKPLQRHHHPTI